MKNKYIFLLVILSVSLLANGYFFVRTYWYSLYDEKDFNCKDMSYVVAPVLRSFGYDTKVIYGSNNDSEGHAWVSINGIYFDAVSLWFSDQSKYTSIDFVDSYPWGYYDELGYPPLSNGAE